MVARQNSGPRSTPRNAAHQVAAYQGTDLLELFIITNPHSRRHRHLPESGVTGISKTYKVSSRNRVQFVILQSGAVDNPISGQAVSERCRDVRELRSFSRSFPASYSSDCARTWRMTAPVAARQTRKSPFHKSSSSIVCSSPAVGCCFAKYSGRKRSRCCRNAMSAWQLSRMLIRTALSISVVKSLFCASAIAYRRGIAITSASDRWPV